MPYAATAPVLNGVTLPRPNEAPEQVEQIGNDVTLANGSIRRYDLGERIVIPLSWKKLTESELATIRGAVSTRAAVPYLHHDGATYVVIPGRVDATPVAGTDPVLFDAELELREQTPRRT